MAASDIKAGRAYVEVVAKDRTDATLKRIGGNLNKVGAGITKAGAAITAVAGGALAGLAASAAKFAEVGSMFTDMAARTGMSVEALSSLGFAANQTGTDLEAVEGASRRMARVISEAAAGAPAATEALAALGLTAANLATLSPDEQFKAIGAAIAAIPDPTFRANAAMEVFGKSGTKLLPMLANMEALQAEAQKLGVVMSTESAAAADALGDAWDTLKAQGMGVVLAIGEAMTPAIMKLIAVVQPVVSRFIRWIRANKEAVITAGLVAVGAAALGTALVGLGATVTAVGTVVTSFAAIVAVLTSPLTLAAIAGFALGAALLWAFSKTKTWEKGVANLKGMIRGFVADLAAGAQTVEKFGGASSDVDELNESLGTTADRMRELNKLNRLDIGGMGGAPEKGKAPWLAPNNMEPWWNEKAQKWDFGTRPEDSFGGPARFKNLPGLGRRNNFGAMNSEAIGTFSAGGTRLLGQGGGASEQKKTNEKLDEVNDNLEDIAKTVEKGGVFV